ncbi:MAG: hypothetical protein OXS35_00140 [Dehalococcoidia bacterium]|nr:hypothetical protein [Dehalococcoidia bacterium]
MDTGAAFSMMPEDMLRQAGLEPKEDRVFTLADGSQRTYSICEARLSLQGRDSINTVVFGPAGRFILGAITLQNFGLLADTSHHRLVDAELTL